MSLKEFAEKVCSNLGMFYYFAFDCSSFTSHDFGLQQNTATAEKKRYCVWMAQKSNIPFDGWRRATHILTKMNTEIIT